MHGILDKYTSMDTLVAMIKEAHPGTEVYNIDAFNDLVSLDINNVVPKYTIVCINVAFRVQDSFIKMWEQVDGVQEKIAPIAANATDGVILICYSQGMHTSMSSAGWYSFYLQGG